MAVSMSRTASSAGPGVSPRIARVREQVIARHGSFIADPNPFQMDVALWRAVAPARSRVQHRAAMLHELVKLATLEIYPDWSLAGEHLCVLNRWFSFPGEARPEVLKRLDEYGLAPAEIKAVKRTVQLWNGSDGWSPVPRDPQLYAIGEVAPENRVGQAWWGEDKTCVFWGMGWSENHSIRDYAKVLRLGYAGIRREVERLLGAADIADGDFPRKENFWRAALSVCDAGILLGKRYSELAARLAAEATDPAERARLSKMADTCARVPAEGARTFHEATQALWLGHVLTGGEDGINANGLGRIDQILRPYYEADLAAGRLTRVEAVELMEEFACKLHLDYNTQAITIGGVDREGHDAATDLTFIILEATRNADLIRDLSIRVSRRTRPDLLQAACDLVARGGGYPFFFNDDTFLPALAEHGVALEDARDYVPLGCIELTIPGKCNPRAVSGYFSSTKCLELALFDGADPRTGERLGARTGLLTDFATFDDVYAAYTKQVELFAGRMAYWCNRGELAQRERGPLPCWSVLTDDCIARGRDITDGGAVYHFHEVCFMGTANTADSLGALRKLVYEERAVDRTTLLGALRRNFDGHEPLRKMLLARAAKYGNDVDEADLLARRINLDFIRFIDRLRSPSGARYFAQLFTFLNNIYFGKQLGATPDGRKAGEPLAYSLAANQGRDQNGVTAMLNSLAKLPHGQAAGGTAAIIDLEPSIVAGEEGVRRLVQIVQAAIAAGVGQMQWNVTTVERLVQAQQDPERYGNIPVRVAGFSQVFKLIDRELQNHIIARTKHKG